MMNKHKGSVISGRIGRHSHGKRVPSSAIFSRPSSSSSRPRPTFSHHPSPTSPLPSSPSACRSPSSSVTTSSSLSRKAVMKMLAVMESSSRGSSGSGANEGDDIAQDFLTSGRTGRRNALHDILSETTTVTMTSASLGPAAADLQSHFQNLTCQDSSKQDEGSEGGSISSQGTSSESERDKKTPNQGDLKENSGSRS